MRNATQVQVGRVSTRRGARLHLVVNGRSFCPSGTRFILDARTLTADDRDALCKRCLGAIREAVKDARRDVETARSYNFAADRALIELSDALRTEEDLAFEREMRERDEAWRAEMKATIAVAPGIMQMSIFERAAAWAAERAN